MHRQKKHYCQGHKTIVHNTYVASARKAPRKNKPFLVTNVYGTPRTFHGSRHLGATFREYDRHLAQAAKVLFTVAGEIHILEYNLLRGGVFLWPVVVSCVFRCPASDMSTLAGMFRIVCAGPFPRPCFGICTFFYFLEVGCE